MLYGMNPILPVDVELDTFLIGDFDRVTDRADLLVQRVRQFERRNEDVERVREKLYKARQKGLKYMDKKNANKLRKPLEEKTWVLKQNAKLETRHGAKFEKRWWGPYRINKRLDKGSYILEEPDGTILKGPVAAKRIRRYYPRGDLLGLGDQTEIDNFDPQEIEDDDDDDEEVEGELGIETGRRSERN
jgi:hypothetical protein